MTSTSPVSALALVCTLTPSPADSSSDLMARQVLGALAEHGIPGSVVRVVDHDVRPGVQLDMGDGDEWPQIRARIMDADILLVGHAHVGGPAQQRVRPRARTPRRGAVRDRRPGPAAHLRQGRDRRRGRKRGRCAPRQRDRVPGPERHGLHDPGPGRHLLERRGHAHDRHQDLDAVPDGRRLDHRRWRRTRPTWPGCSRARSTHRSSDGGRRVRAGRAPRRRARRRGDADERGGEAGEVFLRRPGRPARRRGSATHRPAPAGPARRGRAHPRPDLLHLAAEDVGPAGPTPGISCSSSPARSTSPAPASARRRRSPFHRSVTNDAASSIRVAVLSSKRR